MFQATFRIESRLLPVAAMLACLVTAGCSRPQPQENAALRDVEATVRRFPVDSDTFVLVPDSDPDTRYVPDALPAPLRDDGIHVVFDAALEPVPPNVRMIGTPIKLLRIRARDSEPRS
jgi:hypothetical protein